MHKNTVCTVYGSHIRLSVFDEIAKVDEKSMVDADDQGSADKFKRYMYY